VPFHGRFTEQFTPTTTCPTGDLCATASGSGRASGLGKATESFFGVVNMTLTDPTTACSPDSATGIISDTVSVSNAAYVSSAGKACFTSARTATDNETFLIIGGTGRFVGASGSGTYTSTITFNSNGTGSSSEIYSGSVEIVN
jgi:hypothetical protein